MDKEEILDEIFGNDPLGLLNYTPKTTTIKTNDERLQTSFEEINNFIEKYGNPPEANVTNVAEYQLYSRLKGLREDLAKVKILKVYDRYNLLPDITDDQVCEPKSIYNKSKELNSIDDILGDDSLNILGTGDSDLFKLKNINKQTTMPDYVASRKKCKDFQEFENLFIECQKEIKDGKRKLLPFKNEQQIEANHFYILKGVLLYVEKIGRKKNEKGKTNARLRCIFENGTESDMMLRSLAAELYKNGRKVTKNDEEVTSKFNIPVNEDNRTGFIYILKSKSENEAISCIENLYKIGYSSTNIGERIKNAENEPAFLMSNVEIVASYECYNLNPQKLELLLHRFFGKSCLNIDIFDKNGNRHTPREWFIAPLDIIEQAIDFVLNGEIVNMYYDADRQIIVYR